MLYDSIDRKCPEQANPSKQKVDDQLPVERKRREREQGVRANGYRLLVGKTKCSAFKQ